MDYAILRYPVRIVWTKKSRYCLETTVSGRLFHRVGPTGVIIEREGRRSSRQVSSRLAP